MHKDVSLLRQTGKAKAATQVKASYEEVPEASVPVEQKQKRSRQGWKAGWDRVEHNVSSQSKDSTSLEILCQRSQIIQTSHTVADLP